MTEPETKLEADGVRVVFYRRGDRIAHRIEALADTDRTWVSVFNSLEGAADDAWPPSPPFQQLHVEQRPTGPVVLLIGMAGRTHWSAAVEVAADRRSITFEVAARVQTMPICLGSEWSASLAPERESGPGMKSKPIRIDSASRVEPDRLRVSAELPQTIPATIAWRFAVTLRDDA